MPAKLDEREYRAMAPLAPVAEGADKLIESDYYVEGYATTFDEPYVLWGDYKEIIERNAIAEADVSDVIMQYDHHGRVLARNRNATLVLKPDERGLRIGADLSKGESARQLYEEITNGLVDRMSWAFTVTEDEYDRDTNTRTIRRVGKVYDVSAVSIPANDATEISARSFVDGAIDRERRSDLLRLVQRERLLTQMRRSDA